MKISETSEGNAKDIRHHGRKQSNDIGEAISAVPVSFLSLLDLEWN